ncbi:START domain-containing protein [Saccharospirillum salsuginis]|uniref:START domain-containing protein n=1 Tax=Saccharospirillum salsuginis TaxID=418750 RepID=A0A918KCF7_9GAMM|nr:START domain-containing protein [Saccharospirillum salsuginis]GGX57934.1 hypothetical protein GCM10007392_27040 [Saccharospirillum salsuginis]
MKSLVYGIGIVFGCLLISQAVAATERWELDREEDDIQVFTRTVPGYDVIEVRGTTRIKAPIDQLVAAVSDAAQCPHWIPSCATAEVVDRRSDTEFAMYRRIKNTFPFKDRDYVLEFRIERDVDNGGVIVTFEDRKDSADRGCCVRMERYAGFWRFTPLDRGDVEITYRVHLLPGGGLPNSMVNMGVPDLPYDTLINLKAHLAM